MLVVESPCSPPGPQPFVRQEDQSASIAQLGNTYLCQLHGAVSPDGRRLAYWVFRSGRSEIAIYEKGLSRTVVVLNEELLGDVVWSADGTGLLFVATSGGMEGVPPKYAALRTFDFNDGTTKELMRVQTSYLSAAAWDRKGRLAAATSTSSSGASEYLLVTDDLGVRRHPMPAGTTLWSASPDAAFMMAVSRTDSSVHYWPLATIADKQELRAAPGLAAGIAAWRPGSDELAVVVTGSASQTLEIWSLNGSRRRLIDYTGQGGGLFFRPDGSAIFIGSSTAVDVSTGQAIEIPLARGERLAASLFR